MSELYPTKNRKHEKKNLTRISRIKSDFTVTIQLRYNDKTSFIKDSAAICENIIQY